MKLAIASFVAVFAVDQMSKYLVVEALKLRERISIEVVPPLLNFRMGWNRGINFGLFDGESDIMRWVLTLFAFAVAVAFLWWVSRGERGIGEELSAGAIAGGAAGNALDRLIHGAVADFLNMSCCGIQNPFVFNLADVGVFAGVFGLILFGKLSGRRG